MTTSTPATVLIFLMISFIISALGLGLYYLVKDQGKTMRTAKALTFRVALSIILFMFLFIAFSMGWIAPHSLFGN